MMQSTRDLLTISNRVLEMTVASLGSHSTAFYRLKDEAEHLLGLATAMGESEDARVLRQQAVDMGRLAKAFGEIAVATRGVLEHDVETMPPPGAS